MSIAPSSYGPISWERMISAVEKVRDRLMRTAAALEGAGVPYLVIGGNAVAAWVSRVDEAAVRNTADVDILIRRCDYDRAAAAMSAAGFIPRHVRGIDVFLDGPESKVRDAVYVLYANEKVKSDSPVESPDVTSCEQDSKFRLMSLEGLVRMKLAAFRDKDRMHLRDMLDVGLIDGSWCGRYPTELARRLQELVDNPE